ncbi:MAG TPA: proline iminopeptidase-family hydrolase [Candidatus Udaeobacter sp.]|jgi:proline iminopeptidase|nr:proline iminopeptidase-family hydrolase [Candidatus Udaeobacter sp.]
MRASRALAGAALLAFACAVAGCGHRGLKAGEGLIPVEGGRVWYRVVGRGGGTPLLVLHGGPGVPSYYLKPLAALGEDRPVVFFDQLGCGHSDHPRDSTLWTIDHFVREVGEVRRALGLSEIHLYGHSWGAMLATDYMLTRPRGVKSLILASPALDVGRWVKDADSLRKTLPDSLQRVIDEAEKKQVYDSPAYQAAIGTYYHRYICRRDPWPADVDSAFSQLGQAEYLAMCGPSEFTITGSLRNYDRTARLPELHLPVLFMSGRYDEATPATVEHYRSLVPGARMAILDSSAHFGMQDEPDRYVQVLRDFLRSVERK